MTLKEQIVKKVTMLETLVKESNEEIERLTNQLKETPDALLDRDPEADRKAQIERMNDYLRQEGLLPPR